MFEKLIIFLLIVLCNCSSTPEECFYCADDTTDATELSGKSSDLLITENGLKIDILDSSQRIKGPRWSPEGDRLVFNLFKDKYWEIYTKEIKENAVLKKILFRDLKANNMNPVFQAGEPVTKYLAFSREINGRKNLWLADTEGKNPIQLTFSKISLDDDNPEFYRDTIVYEAKNKEKKEGLHLWSVNINSLIIEKLVDCKEFSCLSPKISHSGDRILYSSDENGDFDLYLYTVETSRRELLKKLNGDQLYPSWSPDDSQILFSSNEELKKFRLYSMSLSSKKVKKIFELPEDIILADWNPVFPHLLSFTLQKGTMAEEIWILGKKEDQ